MYDDFEHQKGPAYVTAKHGIHPEIVQREFERFLTMKSRDPYDLQNKLTSGISNPSPQIQSIVDKSSSTLLTNDEIISIIEFKMGNYAYSYTRDLVWNPTQILPLGLERVICRICHNQQVGVIYDRNTNVGFYAKQALGDHLCNSCKSVQNDISPQYYSNIH